MSGTSPHGARLGRYEVVDEVGRGAMGVVYAAYDPHLQRRVALKVAKPQNREEAEIADRMISEARAQAKVDHPHILPIYETGAVDGCPFIAMKLTSYGNLATWVREQREVDTWMRAHDAVALLYPIADAIDHLHSRGLVHCDLKPANILLDWNRHTEVQIFSISPNPFSTGMYHPYVADFGITRRIGHEALGTEGYMAPEHIRGEPLDAKADIYSLAAIFYECATGRRPTVLHHRALNENSDYFPDVPKPYGYLLSATLAEGLSLQKEGRPASAREMLGKLAIAAEIDVADRRTRRRMRKDAERAMKIGEPKRWRNW